MNWPRIAEGADVPDPLIPIERTFEGFLELATMIDAPGASTGLPPGMVERVHVKTLLLAWAFDETYGFISSLARADAGR